MTTFNPQEINAHIDSMDALCEKGRAQVKELVSKLFGVELVPAVVTPKNGQIYSSPSGLVRYLGYSRNGRPAVFNLKGEMVCGDHSATWEGLIKSNQYTYLAPDLATYIAEGGQL